MRKKALGVSSGIDNLGAMQPHLVICWFITCVVVFLCIMKGIKSLGKVLYVTALMPYFLLLVLLVRSCTMPGAVDGILFYLTPDFSLLRHPQVWLEALIQVFFSVGTTWGVIIAMAGHNSFHANLIRDPIIVTVTGELTSLFAGFVVFATVGFLAHDLQLPVSDVIIPGPGIAFIIYPEAVALLPLPQLWSVLFFTTMLMMSIDSVGGVYVFQLVDWYMGTVACFVMAILECGIVGWCYGAKRFSSDVEAMIGKRLPVIFRIVCFIVLPALITVALVSTLASYKPPTYGEYNYPKAAVGVGWFIAMVTILPIPVVMVIQILKAEGSFVQRVKSAMKPSSAWPDSRLRHSLKDTAESVKDNFLFIIGLK
ncbi:sodium- and chloride-dependent betaine transporter-like [Haliotis rubra]|uniref:sodium- and chloride-dependent betaine transporter-like n=1 Tax=Haliotis rubra TaxID=36100 RepID=UPI001EE57DC6|nr:sodium- and chloride-dependent betaine transporter-like [Haliotis rubra]